MTKYFIHCFCFVLCTCLYLSLQAQKLTYKIFLNKDNIGNLIAERTMDKENVHYLLTSKMLVDKIVKVRVDYKMQSDFSNGKMVQSTAYQKINNKVLRHSYNNFSFHQAMLIHNGDYYLPVLF